MASQTSAFNETRAKENYKKKKKQKTKKSFPEVNHFLHSFHPRPAPFSFPFTQAALQEYNNGRAPH